LEKKTRCKLRKKGGERKGSKSLKKKGTADYSRAQEGLGVVATIEEEVTNRFEGKEGRNGKGP